MAVNHAGKFSIYVKDSQLRHDIELLSSLEKISITELINIILQEYRDSRISDVEYLRKQERDRDILRRVTPEQQEAQAAEQEEEQTRFSAF